MLRRGTRCCPTRYVSSLFTERRSGPFQVLTWYVSALLSCLMALHSLLASPFQALHRSASARAASRVGKVPLVPWV